MTVEKFPTSQEITYRQAVAEWRQIMTEAQVPKERIEAAAEEMGRYWLVLNGIPDRYVISVETSSDVSNEEREGIAERAGQQAEAVVDRYVGALNYAKQVIYELVLQKHGVALNYEPGMED